MTWQLRAGARRTYRTRRGIWYFPVLVRDEVPSHLHSSWPLLGGNLTNLPPTSLSFAPSFAGLLFASAKWHGNAARPRE
jgi:hypothetical protein